MVSEQPDGPSPLFPVRGSEGLPAFPVFSGEPASSGNMDWSDAASSGVDPAGDRDRETKRAIEAVVLAATEPVEPRVIAELVELPVAHVEQLCAELAREYEDDGRGFVLARVAGGYRYQTHPDLAPYVEHFVLEGQHVRLSGAALETLAIVAYKQPISRGQISAIRGVNVESTLSTLIQRGYVEEAGRDPGPGTAVLYGTTTVFLERLGLDSLRDLPEPRRVRPRREHRRGPRARPAPVRRSVGHRRRRSRARGRSRRLSDPSRAIAASTWSASGCRRSSRAPGSGRGAPARS